MAHLHLTMVVGNQEGTGGGIEGSKLEVQGEQLKKNRTHFSGGKKKRTNIKP